MSNQRQISVINPGLPHSRPLLPGEIGYIPSVKSDAFTGPIQGGVEVAAALGTGISAITTATRVTQISRVGNILTTHIRISLIGLAVSTTEDDIIGKGSGTANCHWGAIDYSELGQVLGGTMSCLIVPTTGVADIDLWCATEDTGAEDADVKGMTETALVEAEAAWTINKTIAFKASPPLDGQYMYLAAGAGGTPGTYDAGEFLIVLTGYVE